MRIGVFTALWSNLSFEEALDKAVDAGVTAVEIGAGGYPGSPHCPVDDLLDSETRRAEWMGAIEERGLMLSALSIHNNPVHPDEAVAKEADETYRKAIRLASLLGVPTINTFSGLPAGAPGDSMPNWVTCPWPPHFLDILDYQWNDMTIPYWRGAAAFAADHGVKVAFEMHPGMLVYNVETLLRLREVNPDVLGCNFDPSHLWWNGVDPVAAIRALGDAIYHVHGKDVYVDQLNISVSGCNDNKPYSEIPDRAWTFRSIGYGHGVKAWKDIVSALRMIGYDYVISIEHEDALMSTGEGLGKGIDVLKQASMFEEAGEMFWA
jgi:sugar phosphate isomerase/epimerase